MELRFPPRQPGSSLHLITSRLQEMHREDRREGQFRGASVGGPLLHPWQPRNPEERALPQAPSLQLPQSPGFADMVMGCLRSGLGRSHYAGSYERKSQTTARALASWGLPDGKARPLTTLPCSCRQPPTSGRTAQPPSWEESCSQELPAAD